MATAHIVADSISPTGRRISTVQATFWRPVLAELNTHCDFSRNSASSRARSVKKTITEVENDPAFPPEFPREHVGMSGGDPVDGVTLVAAQAEWADAAKDAITHARKLVLLGVHKSVVNRLLEPFMHHTVVITATEWDNFFHQRLALLPDGRKAADPEMYNLATAIKQSLDESTPKQLTWGEWHLPYITERDHELVEDVATTVADADEALRRISVARCAGTSYLTQDKQNRDLRDDLRIYDMLDTANPPHWSPFEHVAKPANSRGMLPARRYKLRGWASLRWFMENGIPVTD